MAKLWLSVCCVYLAIVSSEVSSQVSPLSPCPRVFSYENDGQTWYGRITIGPPYSSNLNLNVKMDVPGVLPSPYLGRLEMLGERSEVVVSLMNGQNINYRIDFPVLDYIPSITSIMFNGRQICSGPSLQGISFTSVELKHTLSTNLNNVYGEGVPNQSFQPQPGYEVYPTNVMQSYPVPIPQPSNPNINRYPSSSNSNPINPSNPWLNNVNNENNPSDGISQSNPWLQGPPTQAQQPTTTRRPVRLPVTTRRTTTTRIPNTTRRPSTPVARPIPDDKFERPNPDTFAMFDNRRPTSTAASITSPENDRQETRNKCGIAKKLNNALIVRGDSTNKGEWPWLSAIFIKRVSSLNFACGGTLISKELVLTAAHCLGQNNNRQVRKEELIVRLGVFNIQDWVNEDAKSFPVREIILPPSFDGGLVLRNDITLLRINKVSYTDYIIPACLWQESLDVNQYFGTFGTVVGWGRDEGGLIASPEPRLTRQRIVTTSECRESNQAFATLTSSTTLCAGNRNGTGPCNGDSGGGMFININGRWTLRGIVSNSLNVPDAPNVCNLADYLIYTDIAKFIQWIDYYM